MIQTIEQLREQINKASNLISAISFRESIKFKDYKLLRKLERALFKLSFTTITNNEGVLIK